jgi:hypothetical protein
VERVVVENRLPKERAGIHFRLGIRHGPSDAQHA